MLGHSNGQHLTGLLLRFVLVGPGNGPPMAMNVVLVLNVSSCYQISIP